MQKRVEDKSGFTLIELLVVIAIIAILASILFPVFAQTRQKARQTTCQSNIKQITLAWLMYAQDYNSRVCPSYYMNSSGNEIAWDFELRWGEGNPPPWRYGLLSQYTKSAQIKSCPSFQGESWGRPFTGYGYNATYIGGDYYSGKSPAGLGDIMDAANTVVFADCGFGKPVAGANFLRAPSDPLFVAGKAHFRHNNTATAGFADGHCQSMMQKFLSDKFDSDCGALSKDDSIYDLL